MPRSRKPPEERNHTQRVVMPRPARWPSGRTLDQGGALCVLELGTLYVTPAGLSRVRRVLADAQGLSSADRALVAYKAAGALSYEADLFGLESGLIYDIVVCDALIEYAYQDRQPERTSRREADDAYDRAATGRRRDHRGNVWERMPSESDGGAENNDDEPEAEAAA